MEVHANKVNTLALLTTSSTQMPTAQMLSDKNADTAIHAMVATVIGASVIPTFVNWAITASAMGSGVVAIGLCYGTEVSKDEAWALVKEFVKAAGFWFLGMTVGSRILSALLATSGIGYAAAVALDATVSAALAYAIGGCAKAYFKGTSNHKQLGEVFRQRFVTAKKDLAQKRGA